MAGVDEAGRGACAGPLVAAAAILPEGKAGLVPELADSKLLTAKARERCYAQVTRRALAWSVVVVDSGECDRLGMHVANVEALRRALARLEVRPAYVLTDGFPVDGLGVPGLAMWKGDRVAACISAASVIAKVTRDRLMTEMHDRWPVYDFATHKGYITEEHAEALTEHGPCPIHRMRFVNVRRAAGLSDEAGSDLGTISLEPQLELEMEESVDERGGSREVRDRDGADALPGVPRRRRHLQVRRGDRPALLPVQPGRREGPHRGRRRVLRGLDDRRLGLGHVPPRPVRQERQGADLQGRQRRGAGHESDFEPPKA